MWSVGKSRALISVICVGINISSDQSIVVLLMVIGCASKLKTVTSLSLHCVMFTFNNVA